MAMLIKADLFEYTINAMYVSAIINDDYSGLPDQEAIDLKGWLDEIEGWANDQGEFMHFDIAGDGYQFARCEVCGLLCNVVDLLVIYKTEG